MRAGMGAIVLTACAKQEEVAAVPPPPPGAVAGSIAADRDGDGIVDGYYTADGMYHANAVPMPPPPPPPAPSGVGERDRKSVVQGKSVSVRVDLGGRRIIKKNNNKQLLQ